ncbi:transposase [Desulfamplus magnetovallimortis]|uniref:Transposase n=2 Tax=Desulfamplus magnetovallimortis TaxID=1246637 RepID=A0A1W1HFM0_9BACT|nr:transposase [Desulfamplus magnetovallimortis]
MDTVNDVMIRLKTDELEKLKASMVRTLIEKKVLHKFRLFKKYFVVGVDGTGVHNFSKRHCEHCLTKTSKNGKVTFFHNVMEAKLLCPNGFSISLATEWVENPEGDFKKQDCERKAFKRLAARLKDLYPRLPICIAADGLYPTKPFFDTCAQNGWPYIVTFKDGNLPSVWEEVDVLLGKSTDNKRTLATTNSKHQVNIELCWINAIDYAGHKVNWIECIEYSRDIESNETQTSRFVHLTNIEITWRNAPEVSQSGRLRWKIENEGFNCQKNHGYNLQHKYSRNSYCATKNYYQCLQIAHLLNQLVELSANFLNLVTGKKSIKHLWKCMIAFLICGFIDADELSLLLRQRCQIRYG